MVRRIGFHLGLWALVLAAAPGCESTDKTYYGTPKVGLGAVDGGSVVVTFSDPCAIEVDFGSLPNGQGTSAFIQVENIGVFALDLSEINPSLKPEFGVNYGAQPPIEPGAFAQFAVTFEASTPGTVNSSFTIATDGYNSDCPSAGSSLGGSILTIALTGTASN
jgi:hypothetical protein